MEELLKEWLEVKFTDPKIDGILLINEKGDRLQNELDIEVVIVCDRKQTEHYIIGGLSIEIQYVDMDEINRTLLTGNNKRLIDWLLNGSILHEKSHYISEWRKKINQFPINERKYKMTIEFSKLVRRYVDGKCFFNNGHYLDSFNSILHALHHLARLSVIEHGSYPEVTVWRQIKVIEPEIYKLYEEMVMGEETLEKRLELLLLASSFSLNSKTKIASSHLTKIMESSKEPWTIERLTKNREIQEYAIDLTVLLEYLIQKGIIDIVKGQTDKEGVFQKMYYVK